MIKNHWSAKDNFLYEITNSIVNENKRNILELGSGVSTKLMNLFDVRLLSVEENVEYFNNLNVSSEYIFLPYKKVKYKNMSSRIYDGLEEYLKGKKFNLIIVDGPLGYDVKISRIDLLHIVKNNITEDTVILLDDYHRSQEQKLIKELSKICNFDFVIKSDDSKQFIKLYNITKK